MLTERLRRPRVAVVCDMREENWYSMNLVADRLLGQVAEAHAGECSSVCVCPPMRRFFTRRANAAGRRFNADRLLNRFWTYPRHLAARRGEFDVFHIVDHSYAHLVHRLPAERTVVTCHDLDTFRCLLDPRAERRSRPFVWMTKRVLGGLEKAARVVCVSSATRDELLSRGLLSPERVEVVHNGVSPVYSPSPDRPADAEAERLLGAAAPGAIDVLHVGSTIPRKRVDVLLRVFAGLREQFPAVRLVRVGGEFSDSQQRLIEDLRLGSSVMVLPFLEERTLAAVYRRAALLLQPSEREGFGLPVAEALACRLPVLASDLPVLREVGGAATTYCEVGDVSAWTEAAIGLLKERQEEPFLWSARRTEGASYAKQFSWAEHARRMVAIYRELL